MMMMMTTTMNSSSSASDSEFDRNIHDDCKLQEEMTQWKRRINDLKNTNFGHDEVRNIEL